MYYLEGTILLMMSMAMFWMSVNYNPKPNLCPYISGGQTVAHECGPPSLFMQSASSPKFPVQQVSFW